MVKKQKIAKGINTAVNFTFKQHPKATGLLQAFHSQTPKKLVIAANKAWGLFSRF